MKGIQADLPAKGDRVRMTMQTGCTRDGNVKDVGEDQCLMTDDKGILYSRPFDCVEIIVKAEPSEGV